jgi:hypothetical protein
MWSRLLLWVGLAGVASACADGGASPDRAPLDGVFTPNVSSAEGPCVDGLIETCSITLGEHDGVLSCYEGTRLCNAGVFGECANGHEFELSRAELEAQAGFGTTRPLALSTSTACLSNPCNRYCREFDEVPPGGGLIPAPAMGGPALSNWNSGDLAQYPLASVALGAKQPCQVAKDCQFNTVCQDPARGTCAHNVCSTGDALLTGCSQCSDAVCGIEPSCCGLTTTCAHDPCVPGAALAAGCDQCVALVCGSHPECCSGSGSWDANCIGYIATACAPLEQSCSCPAGSLSFEGTCYSLGDPPLAQLAARSACAAKAPGWDLIQIDDFSENAVAAALVETESDGSAWIGASAAIGATASADHWTWLQDNQVFFINDQTLGGSLQTGYTYSNWTFGEPTFGALAGALMGDNGLWQDADPTLEHDYVCEGPPNELSPKRPTAEWSADCVDLVAEVCGAQCPTSTPVGFGACAPRVASKLDASCEQFDLALGPTCSASGVPQVPVCNRGQAPSPAGIKLVHLPAGQIGSASPDLTGAETCTLNEAVPPGRCVVVDSCPNLSAGRQLMVNPPGPDHVAGECRGDENWTIYEPVSCGNPLCEASVHDSVQVAASCAIDIDNPTTIDPDTSRVVLDNGNVKPSCASGEILWAGSCYFVSSDIATWDTAQQRCRNRGAGWDLVALNFAMENVTIRNLAGFSNEIQIGFTDQDAEGVHEWSNGTCVGWVNWRDDAPNVQPNDPGGEQQCSRMTLASSVLNWEDKNCFLDQARYVCEGPVSNARGNCGNGQFEGPNGDCFEVVPGAMTWAEARTACQTRGDGWDLAVVGDYDTTDFLVAHSNCQRAWLNYPAAGFADWDFGEPDDLVNNCPSTGPRGFWHDEDCSETFAALCQGPAAVASGTVFLPVADAAACTGDDQYYFSGSFTPDSLTLCPAACDRARSARVPLRVDVACTDTPVRAAQTVRTELYEANCDGEPQWDFLFYDSVTPGDSSIVFEARTAPLAANLSGAFTALATAHAVPEDTQRCEISPPECPVSLFSALGSPGFRHNALELRITLVPGSNGEGPMLRDWKVQFSCPPSE